MAYMQQLITLIMDILCLDKTVAVVADVDMPYMDEGIMHYNTTLYCACNDKKARRIKKVVDMVMRTANSMDSTDYYHVFVAQH